jgi:hypothetical protein
MLNHAVQVGSENAATNAVMLIAVTQMVMVSPGCTSKKPVLGLICIGILL